MIVETRDCVIVETRACVVVVVTGWTACAWAAAALTVRTDVTVVTRCWVPVVTVLVTVEMRCWVMVVVTDFVG